MLLRRHGALLHKQAHVVADSLIGGCSAHPCQQGRNLNIGRTFSIPTTVLKAFLLGQAAASGDVPGKPPGASWFGAALTKVMTLSSFPCGMRNPTTPD